MSNPVRPRRSVLYMPGSNARALDKARTLPADGYILDLEDAVAPDAKIVARQQICEAVKAGGYGQRELAIRVNSLATPWGHDDIVAASTSRGHAILIPKVESADTVRQVENIMNAASAYCNKHHICIVYDLFYLFNRLLGSLLSSRRISPGTQTFCCFMTNVNFCLCF